MTCIGFERGGCGKPVLGAGRLCEGCTLKRAVLLCWLTDAIRRLAVTP